MDNRLERAASCTIAVAAIVFAVSFAHREFFPQAASPSLIYLAPPPVFVPDWQSMIASSVLIGPANAPVKVIEFADFECTECRTFEPVLGEVKRRFGDSVAIAFVDYPMPNHRFASSASRAAECAAQQGGFVEFHDLLYAKQDSIGLKSWVSYALDAHLRDIAAFAACSADDAESPRMVAATELGIRDHIVREPTIIVNGWRFVRQPAESVLAEAIAGLIIGKAPRHRLP